MAVIGVSPSAPPPRSQAWAPLPRKPTGALPHTCGPHSLTVKESVREPKFSRVTVFSQPTGICNTHLKKFFTFQTLVPINFKFCHTVFMKSGLRKTFFFLVIFFGGGGISRNVI